ncbi:ECF transporter S component [Halarsenatibacter silvermanii]|uniref:Uncharacterized membrane protein n=1 Tax=Halarsenatibacter silvermanii TaxID=321763 RepID=A0A1G9MB94_9FIRM|nr:ECF transporter S component [Halarsenatibacter silvermanii]SDL71394.1 Uncharacterized membrane protein [Halarsenatibacter silvermanii]
MPNEGIQKITLYGIFIALTAMATMAITIPMIGTQGYINIGDTMIFAAALLLGPWGGLAAGAIGSAMADILLGYAFWAPWTLVVKGMEGYIAGRIGHRIFHRHKKPVPRVILGLSLAALWMVFGYFVAGGFMVGFEAALGGIPGDLLQGGASVAITIPLAYLLGRLISSEEISLLTKKR